MTTRWAGERRSFVGPLTVSQDEKANVAVNAVSKGSLDRLKRAQKIAFADQRITGFVCGKRLARISQSGLCSVYGWLVSKDAPKEVIEFMKVWLGKDVQTKLAAEGLSIPMVKGDSQMQSRILFTKPWLWR
jgi:raffinose/stachyose/melibiose transport system substrate-binding protein